MQKWKNGWKVVHMPVKDKYFSVFRRSRYNDEGSQYAAREYIIGKTCMPRPDCGPLAIFVSRRTARAFKKERSWQFHDGLRIIKCKYIQSKYQKLWRPSKYTYHALPDTKKDCFPEGTDFARKIKCLEVVS